jgi:hypothetical protein
MIGDGASKLAADTGAQMERDERKEGRTVGVGLGVGVGRRRYWYWYCLWRWYWEWSGRWRVGSFEIG